MKSRIKEVLPLLVKSNFLTFQELMCIHWVLRIEWKTIDFILNCEPQECGPGRYLQWKRSLFINPDRDVAADRAYYNSILNPANEQSNPQLHEGTLRLSGVMGEISRDVVRTYQTNPLFREGGSGRDMLQRILSCLVKSRPDVGYCQGMNFVVGAIIIGRLPHSLSKQAIHEDSDEEPEEDGDDTPEPVKLPDSLMNEVECDVFMLMLELFDRNSKLAMCGLWAPRVPKLKLRVYQLDRLLKWNYPKLHDHFAKLQLSPEVLTAQWFVTLFAYNLPLETTLHLWDYLFEAGWEGIFKVAISLLGAMEPQFMALEDLESFALLMREWKKLGHLNIDMSVNALLNRCHKLVINEEVLTRLQECFGMEILSLAIYCYKEDAKLSGSSTPGGGGGGGGSVSGGSVHGSGRGGGFVPTPTGSISSTVGLHNAPQHHHHPAHHGGAVAVGGGQHQRHSSDGTVHSSVSSVSSKTNGEVCDGNLPLGQGKYIAKAVNKVHKIIEGSGGGGGAAASEQQQVSSSGAAASDVCDGNLPLGQGKYIAKAVNKVHKIIEGGGGGAVAPPSSPSSAPRSGPNTPTAAGGGQPARELAIGQGKYLNLAMKSVSSLFASGSGKGVALGGGGSSVGSSTVGTPSPGSSFSSTASVSNMHNTAAFHQESLSMSAPTPADVEEQEEDERIKLGEELPTYWLLRYGSKLNPAEIDQLINYRILLRRLEKTVEVDKAQLHAKIIKACEYHRETEEELALAEEAVRFHGANVTRLTEEFQEALLHAQDLAEAVAKLMDVYSVKKVTSTDMRTTPTSSSRDVSGFGGINNVVTPTKNRSNSIGSFLSSGNSAGKSQSMASLNSLMRERGLITASPIPTHSGGGSSGGSGGGGSSSAGDGIAARSVLPDRRFSFRASLFSEKSDNDADPSAVSAASAAGAAPAASTRRASGSSAFIFTGMRSAVRFPTGLVTTPVPAQPSSDEPVSPLAASANGIAVVAASTATVVSLGEDPLTAQKSHTSSNSSSDSINEDLTQSANSRTMSHGLSDLLVAAAANDSNDSSHQAGLTTASSDTEEEEVDLTGGSRRQSLHQQQQRGRMIGISGNQSTLVGIIDETEMSGASAGGGSGRSWSERLKSGLSSLRNGSSGSLGHEEGSGSGISSSSSSKPPLDAPHGRSLATDAPGPASGKLLKELTSPELEGNSSSSSRSGDRGGTAAGAAAGLAKNVSFETISSYSETSNKVVSIPHSPNSMDNFSVHSETAGVNGANGSSGRVVREGVASVNSNGSSSGKNDLSPASDGITRQLKHLEAQSKNSQQTIIEVHRSLEEEKKYLRASKKRLETAKISGDEALVWKKSLCDQLQLLVEDYNKGRTQKLIFISENYLL